MKIAVLLTLLILASCSPEPQGKDPTLKPVSITLPDDSVQFPQRPGVEAVVANCGACHSAEMTLNQPKLTRAQWQSIIDKMRSTYKAPIDPAAEPAILDYLEATSAAIAPPS